LHSIPAIEIASILIALPEYYSAGILERNAAPDAWVMSLIGVVFYFLLAYGVTTVWASYRNTAKRTSVDEPSKVQH